MYNTNENAFPAISILRQQCVGIHFYSPVCECICNTLTPHSVRKHSSTVTGETQLKTNVQQFPSIHCNVINFFHVYELWNLCTHHLVLKYSEAPKHTIQLKIRFQKLSMEVQLCVCMPQCISEKRKEIKYYVHHFLSGRCYSAPH